MTKQNEREPVDVAWKKYRDDCDSKKLRISNMAAWKLFADGYAAGQPQWMAVSNRLPDSGALCIVYGRYEWGDSCEVATSAARLTSDGRWMDMNSEYFLEVIAWMPIPSYTDSDNTEVSDGE